MNFEVYTDGVLEFVGGYKDTAEFIGISRTTLYDLSYGFHEYIPKKARCDTLTRGAEVWTKKPVEEKKIEVGYTLLIKGKKYRINDIEVRQNDLIYTVNDFKVRALKPFANYNAIYTAVIRRLRKIATPEKNISSK